MTLTLTLATLAVTGAREAVGVPRDGVIEEAIACGRLTAYVAFEDAVPADVAADAAGAMPGEDRVPDEANPDAVPGTACGQGASDIDWLSAAANAVGSGTIPVLSEEQREELAGFLRAVRSFLGIDWIADIVGMEEEIELLEIDDHLGERELMPTVAVEDGVTPDEIRDLESELIARVIADTQGRAGPATRSGGLASGAAASTMSGNVNFLAQDFGRGSMSAAAPAAERSFDLFDFIGGLLSLIPTRNGVLVFVGTLVGLRVLLLVIERRH